jgi:hypothetical protein
MLFNAPVTNVLEITAIVEYVRRKRLFDSARSMDPISSRPGKLAAPIVVPLITDGCSKVTNCL